ncbi:dockerin type I domain-containing protein [Patescibacteria group bacterium]|nr:dockerin type I domain-containing protein [Patescibacteria group bacterium]
MTSKVAMVKTAVVLVILVLVGVLGVLGMGTVRTYLSGATAGYEPKNVVPTINDSEVVINWNSDKPSRGYIQYGTTPASLLLSVPSRDELESSTPDTNHRISIKTFKGNTTYYFRIRAGTDTASYTEWEVFDNGGIPWQFKTKGDGSGSSPTYLGRGLTPTPDTTTVTIAPLPTVASDSSAISGTQVAPTGTLKACAAGVDYNGDGVVNSLDMIYCNRSGGAIQAAPVVTVAPTAAVSTSSGSGTTCKSGVDYNKDGTINSLDMIYCRQNLQK